MEDIVFEQRPCGDTLEREFTHANWEDYFREIPSDTLRSAVILVDPDNGLEVKSSRLGNLPKYIKYSEAKNLFERMSRDSILALYSHLAHVKREAYLANHLHTQINERLNCPTPITNGASRIALVEVAKVSRGRERVQKAISENLRRHLLVKNR